MSQEINNYVNCKKYRIITQQQRKHFILNIFCNFIYVKKKRYTADFLPVNKTLTM